MLRFDKWIKCHSCGEKNLNNRTTCTYCNYTFLNKLPLYFGREKNKVETKPCQNCYQNNEIINHKCKVCKTELSGVQKV